MFYAHCVGLVVGMGRDANKKPQPFGLGLFIWMPGGVL
ncbi:hypothetical protein B0I24_1191, partial [Aliidiomarina maris]